MVTKSPKFLTTSDKDELKSAKKDAAIAQAELEDAILELEEAQSRVCQCQDALKEANEWLNELMDFHSLTEYNGENISEELPSLARIAGYSLFLITYRNGKAVSETVLKNREGDAVRTWNYIPSLADLFEATNIKRGE